jgi:hypothetical protein
VPQLCVLDIGVKVEARRGGGASVAELPSSSMSGSVALSRWLVLVACLRLLSVYIGLFDPAKFRTALIDAQPDLGECTLSTPTLCPLSCNEKQSSRAGIRPGVYRMNIVLPMYSTRSLSERPLWPSVRNVDTADLRAVPHLRTQPHQRRHLWCDNIALHPVLLYQAYNSLV